MQTASRRKQAAVVKADLALTRAMKGRRRCLLVPGPLTSPKGEYFITLPSTDTRNVITFASLPAAETSSDEEFFAVCVPRSEATEEIRDLYGDFCSNAY